LDVWKIIMRMCQTKQAKEISPLWNGHSAGMISLICKKGWSVYAFYKSAPLITWINKQHQ
jgi:hypothetical protein